MLSFEHTNVMSLHGVCFDGAMPLIIMPFMSNGSVLEYIRNHKSELHLSSGTTIEEVCISLLCCVLIFYSTCRLSQLARLYLAYVIKFQKEWSISQSISLFIEISQQGIACKYTLMSCMQQFKHIDSKK